MVRGIRFPTCALATLLLVPGAILLEAAEDRPAPNPITEIVAVGRAPGRIVLATPALPLSAGRWRFRVVHLEPETEAPQAVVLSRSGTKALITFSDGSEGILDLTQKISTVRAGQLPAAQHRLPGQLFPVARAGRICLIDDSGEQPDEPCQAATRASVGGNGRVLYVGPDGHLFVVPLGAGNGAEQDDPVLPYRLAPGAHYELIAGSSGNRPEFLLLNQQDAKVQVVDPTRELPVERILGTYDSWEAAALRAVLDFDLPAGMPQSSSSQPIPNDDALRDLATHLIEQARPETYDWSFFRVQPEAALYSPVLEFAANEPVYPSDFAIWDRLNPISKSTSREDYHTAYDTLGAERFRRCTVYYRAASYPGSWLLEYWYYYPFDEGKPRPHIHDSEHVFIEVDKLGGTVRSVLASAHDSLAPNNIYSTFTPGAQPITLPLFALVEFGKHAMSPDIDGDGRFTRGVDVNVGSARFQIWGVRDLGNKRGKMMEPYRPYMTLPRKKEDRLALQDSSRFFPGLDVRKEMQACSLMAFPEEPPCPSCPAGSAKRAMTDLIANTDARQPSRIYKPWVLPWDQVRLGVAFFDRAANHLQLYAAYVTDLHQRTGGRFPFSGRLSLDAMYSPFPLTVQSQSGSATIETRLSHATQLGARFERLLTNTQGFYGGFSAILRRHASHLVNGPLLSGPSWEYEGIWYRLGYVLELPSQRKGNLTHHIGVIFHGKTFRFEWRVSLGVLRRHGRDHFGIRPDEASP